MIADARFNAHAHFEAVHGEGGRAFFDFDSSAKHSGGRYPHFDEQFTLYHNERDEYMRYYNQRAAIENTNHDIKSLFKRSLRARKEESRDCEALALIVVYALSRFRGCGLSGI
jgi:hypothetical protein